MPERPRRAIGVSRKESLEREVDDELAFHLEMRERALRARGLDAEAARAEAQRQFGDIERVRRSCVTHDQERLAAMQRTTRLDELRQDLAYALRSARRYPLFTVLVAFTIALGIGANTSIFAVVNAVLLRKLPVRAPEELMVVGNPAWVGAVAHSSNANIELFDWRTYTTFRERSGAFAAVLAGARMDTPAVLTEAGQVEPGHPRGRFVSGNYFSVLGVPAQVGRVFDGSEDATIGGSPVVVISHGYWTREFRADPRVVGRDIHMNGVRMTIIGVTPAGFLGDVVGQNIDVFAPATMQAVLQPGSPWLLEPDARWLQMIGRRRAGVTEAQAIARTRDEVQRLLGEQFSLSDKDRAELDVQVTDGSRGVSRLRASFAQPLIVLLVGVGLLLLLICANVANLLLSRATARGREMSVRLAIGAGRGRLVRQLLTESLVLGALGTAGGLLLARWGSQWLVAIATQVRPGSAPPLDLHLDGMVLGFTALLCVLAVTLFGLAPAIRTVGVELADALRAGGRAMRAGGSRWSLGHTLIAAQVTLSLVLLVGASMLVRSLRNVERADTGLDRDHLAILDVDARTRGHAGPRLAPFARGVVEAVGRVPGVRAVTWSNNGVFSGTESATTLSIPGFSPTNGDDSVSNYDLVAAGYVEGIGGRVIRGRDLTQADLDGRARVALVNETFARHFFAGSEAIGRSIPVTDSTSAEIVGVIADVRDHTLTGPVERRFYVPTTASDVDEPGDMKVIVRSSGDPAHLLPQLRAAVLSVDPELTLTADALTTLMAQSVGEERLLARLASALGALALLLASIGLYGVMAYAVSRRTGELGLRAALGASRSMVVRLVLGDALLLVTIGAAVGIPAGIAAGRLLQSQLHGIGAVDPVSIVVGVVVIVVSALVAALVPALRAARVSPMVALGGE